MSTQTKGLARTLELKFYDASSQSDKFYHLLSTNKKVIDFDEEHSGIAMIKYHFVLAFLLMKS